MRPLLGILVCIVVAIVVWTAPGPASPRDLPGTGGLSVGVEPKRAHDRSSESGAPSDRVSAVESVAEASSREVLVIATLCSGEPAAGATVRYGDLPRHHSTLFRRRDAVDPEVLLVRGGGLAVADEAGRVTLPVDAGATLCVRSGGEYGEAVVQDAQRVVRLALEPDVTLRVQIVDIDGRPRARCRVTADVQAESRWSGRDEVSLPFPRTDEAGMAVFPHVQTAVTMPGPDTPHWRMVLSCSMAPDVQRVVTPADLQSAQVLWLRVPAGGAVAAEVVHADGSSSHASVQLEDAATGRMFDPERDDGTEWFRQLPLGRRWVLHVSSFGHRERRELFGPTCVDEVVRARVELPLRPISVHGRIVRPDGVPVPQTDMRFSGPRVRFVHDRDRSSDGSLGHTVGNFGFWGVLPADTAVVHGATLEIEGGPWCMPTTVVLPPLQPGNNHLGDVVVNVAQDEVLLASVTVRANGQNVTDQSFAFLNGAGDVHMNSVQSIGIAAPDRISFRGCPTPVALEIRCGCSGYLTQSVPVQLGQHTVVDLRQRSASLALRMHLPPVPPSLLSVKLLEPGGRTHSAQRVSFGEELRWSDLTPGVYTLRVLLGDRCVFEVAQLRLDPGDNMWPRDGSAIDLRDTGRAFYVGVRALHGGAVEYPRCFILSGDRGEPPQDHWPSSHGQWFLPDDDSGELAIVAEGFVPTMVPRPVGDTVVELVPGTLLRVHAASEEHAVTIVQVVEDAVPDAWLRALDTDNLHGAESATDGELVERSCAPGTVVEVSVERGGVRGPAQRIVIGRRAIEVVAQ